jgi:hypothetical protein
MVSFESPIVVTGMVIILNHPIASKSQKLIQLKCNQPENGGKKVYEMAFNQNTHLPTFSAVDLSSKTEFCQDRSFSDSLIQPMSYLVRLVIVTCLYFNTNAVQLV